MNTISFVYTSQQKSISVSAKGATNPFCKSSLNKIHTLKKCVLSSIFCSLLVISAMCLCVCSKIRLHKIKWALQIIKLIKTGCVRQFLFCFCIHSTLHILNQKIAVCVCVCVFSDERERKILVDLDSSPLLDSNVPSEHITRYRIRCNKRSPLLN